MASSSEIAQRILHAVLAGKLGAGDRIGEQPLATLFDCSRTVVREALTELAVRGLVASSARRGWYVVELTPEQARQAFEAREVIETSVLRRVRTVAPAAVKRLRAHVERQEEAIREDDAGLRSFLLGDFHVCMAECLLGNAMLTEALRDLTARTMLVAPAPPVGARGHALVRRACTDRGRPGDWRHRACRTAPGEPPGRLAAQAAGA